MGGQTMLRVMGEVDSVAAAAMPHAPLALANLLNDLETLVGLFANEVQRQSWLNAFLLAAGINQVIEDNLHEDGISLPRVQRHVRRVLPGPVGAPLASLIAAADAIRWVARSSGRLDSVEARWQRSVAGVVDRLAELVIDPTTPGEELALYTTVRTLQ